MTSKVKLIAISYCTVFDECSIKVHCWGEHTLKDAIETVKQISKGFSAVNEKILIEQRCVTVGDEGQHQQHYFLLYPHEQKDWIKTLTNELL